MEPPPPENVEERVDRGSPGGASGRAWPVLFAGLAVVALAFGTLPRFAPARARVAAWVAGESAGDGGTWWCPMDPQVVRPRKGTCPICSMELVPFDGSTTAGADPGVLQLGDRQVQQAGVRIGTAARRELVRVIDTTGRVELDPRRVHPVTVDYPGTSRIESLHVHAPGEKVRHGQVVAEVENPRAEALLEEYRQALRDVAAKRAEGGDAFQGALERVSRLRAQFDGYGLPDPHVNFLAAKAKHILSDPVFPVISFAEGVALEAPARTEGQRVEEGGALLEVADLRELWLYVDLYEHEVADVEVGQRVEFTTRAAPGRVFRSEIQFVEPLMQERSQTIRARCRATNAAGELVPGMVVAVRVFGDPGTRLSVPESAVLQSGRRNVVIVSEGAGRFRPKLVELGGRHLSPAPGGDEEAFGASEERYHEILSGLDEGERVVVAGNFLLNAEAQFQGILKKMFEADEARRRAPALSPEARAAAERVLDDYLAIASALVEDDGSRLPRLAAELEEHAGAAALRDVDPAFPRLTAAAAELRGAASGEAPDLEAARRSFGSLSREVVGYVGRVEPASVAEGELFLFRCPMADDYGYDLWVQRERELQNPYMGQRMVECGMPAELP